MNDKKYQKIINESIQEAKEKGISPFQALKRKLNYRKAKGDQILKGQFCAFCFHHIMVGINLKRDSFSLKRKRINR